MKDYQRRFLDYVVEARILRFGDFTLKSGRQSPYFFNAGLFNTGRGLEFIGRSYAEALRDAGLDYDVIFGPAYKGIALAAATAIALSAHFQQDKPWCFNRKEAKAHGEGGSIVGAPLQGRVLIADDVITAGTAIREAVALITSQGARPAGVVVALDRQERGRAELSAIQEVEREYGIPVISIVRLRDIVAWLEQAGDPALREHLTRVKDYQNSYGV